MINTIAVGNGFVVQSFRKTAMLCVTLNGGACFAPHHPPGEKHAFAQESHDLLGGVDTTTYKDDCRWQI